MTAYLITAQNWQDQPSSVLGGKARNLFYLQHHGLPVPALVCVSATAYEQAVAPVREKLERLLIQCQDAGPTTLQSLSEQLQKQVLNCELPPGLRQALQDHLSKCSEQRFSVRSSASSEDGNHCSFAGQFATWLNVPAHQIEERIKACWASGFAPGVLAYTQKMQLSEYHHPMAVVIQQMVVAESAGVLFQADPQGDLSRHVIVAGLGLGEGVVSDQVATDTYYYWPMTETWQLNVGAKTTRITCQAEGGTCTSSVPSAQQEDPVLNLQQRKALVQASQRIAQIYPDYQDIEWAFDPSNHLYILQSRPITTVPKGEQRRFDNSNIIESYPGVITPMTFSILHRDYHHCVRDVLRRCGARRGVVERYEEVLQQLVGYLRGRAYYNMGSWYRVVLLAPFFKKRLTAYFEQMIGTDSRFQPGRSAPALRWWDKALMAVRFPCFFLINLIRHDRLIRYYFRETEKIRQETEQLALEHTATDALIAHLNQSVNAFTRLLGIPILNDFFAMIFMALTRQQFDSSKDSDGHALLNQLLAHQKIASTRPVHSMQALARQVTQDQGLRLQVEQLARTTDQGTEQLVHQLKSAGYASFAQGLQTHLTEYGHRAPRELLMEAQTFQDNPQQLLSLLLQTAAHAQATPSKDQNPEQALEQQLAHHLQQAKHPRLLKWLLRKTRKTIAHREATRLDRGLHFALFRRLLQHIGTRLVEEGVLDQPEHLLYLTLTELEQYRTGINPDSDLRAVVSRRQAAEQQWREHQPPEHIVTRGTVGNCPIPDATPAAQTDGLQGTGVAGGTVTAPACVLRDPHQMADVAGSILVSETTDPGWVFVMTLAAGLISERGSLLSHTAIIGRELGIPTVIGVKGATRAIKSGQTLTLHGTTGHIQQHPTTTEHPHETQ